MVNRMYDDIYIIYIIENKVLHAYMYVTKSTYTQNTELEALFCRNILTAWVLPQQTNLRIHHCTATKKIY